MLSVVGLGRCARLGAAYQPKLRQCSHSIVQTDLFCDLAILDTKHGRAGEVHLPTRRRREGADEEVTEGRAGVRASTLPATHHELALSNEIGRTLELEIGNASRNPVMNASISA